MHIARYSDKEDKAPKSTESSWKTIASSMLLPRIRAEKDGPLWSPILIQGKRKAENVELVEALVLDFDEGHDWTDFAASWSELEFVIHTTFTHTPEKPKWRAIFPLASPIPGSEWKELFRKLAIHLGKGCCDTTCCDPSRMFYLPSCPDPEHFYSVSNVGAFLEPNDYPDVEAEPEPVYADKLEGDTRPGADFCNRADWHEILEPHGWKHLGKNRWRRPGKKEGVSALADECFYCFSSNANVPASKALNKFALYTHLNFAGDFAAAARDLSAKGYGSVSPSARVQSGIVEQLGVGEPDKADTSRYSDAGTSMAFCAWAKDRLRFAWGLGRWVRWDGRRWKPDEIGGGLAIELMREFARTLRVEAAGVLDSDESKKLWGHGMKLDKSSQINTILEMAKRNPLLAMQTTDFDKDPELICCENGVLDLRTGELGKHDPDLLMTKLAPVEYDADADCPLWTGFLQRVLPDPDLRNFIWKAVGYSASGLTGQRMFFFLYGALGGNGKSTFAETIGAALGEYASAAAPETFMIQDRQQTNDIARLQSARFVRASEAEEGKRLAESFVKRITGNDPITARYLHQEFFEYTPQFKLWMIGNHKPVIRGTDNAIWDRVTLIPFEHSIPVDERDPEFGGKLLAELPGIFYWIAAGYIAYKSEGLVKPLAVLDAVKEYRDESDVLGQFLEECTNSDPFGSVGSSQLYKAYCHWSNINGIKPNSQTFFSKKLKERGLEHERSTYVRGFRGLTLLENWVQE